MLPSTGLASWSPRGDSNPPTCRLQIGCAAIAPLGQKDTGLASLLHLPGPHPLGTAPDIQCPRLESTSYEGPAEGTIRESLKSWNQYRILPYEKSRLGGTPHGGMKAGPRATVLYDGDCPLCRGAVKWMAKVDWLGRVEWMPGQELEVLPEGLAREDLDAAMYLLDDGGRLHGGFLAVRRLALLLPPLLPIAPFLWLPGARFLGVKVYAFIARNRGCFMRAR